MLHVRYLQFCWNVWIGTRRKTHQRWFFVRDSESLVGQWRQFFVPTVWDGDLYKTCLNARFEECRRNYNAELFQSAAVSTAIAAGCVGLTGGSGLIVCLALALAAHAAGIAAANERYQGCRTRAQYDCRTQAGG